ncbi:hypothetical protein CR513_23243, partial [Mucuna pruriens]
MFWIFFNFVTCVDCIKGKHTAKARKSRVTRNICGLSTLVVIGGFRYGWVELLHEKFEFLDVFKTLKVAIELKLGMKIMGDEFYGKYNEIGRNSKPFARIMGLRHNIPCLPHLKKWGC